jgi:hypothetical protein
MANSVNTFTELNTDSHPVNTQPTVMTDAINATLTTKGENQLILQNMEGNHQVASLTTGFRPLGVAVFNDITYIVSGNFDDEGGFLRGEVGTFPSPDWANLLAGTNLDPNNYLPLQNVYSPLYNFSTSTDETILDSDLNYEEPFRTQLLNFRSDRLIEVELQPSYDESVNIVFTDDFNNVRLVNSRFRLDDSGKNASIADRRQDRDTNVYSELRFGYTRLIRQAQKIVNLEYLGVNSGGQLDAGGYRFYFRYTDSDGAITDVVEESRLVSVGYNDHGGITGEITDKLVSFRLSNLDRSFSGVRVYYSVASGQTAASTTVKEIENIYDITGDSIEITISGIETTIDIDSATLNLDYSSIDTVKTITQYNDRLLLGNITNAAHDYTELQELSQRLRVQEYTEDMAIKELGSGYATADNVYHKLGYWAGETYELAIVYILKDGQGTTPAFPIRGGDNYANNFSYSGINPITTADGFVSGASSENRLGVYRTDKDRRKLKGVDNHITEVRYFKINVSSIKNQAYITANTDGFFFVRKERKKDCVVQGYICNALKEPISQGIISNPPNLIVANPTYDGSPRNDWHAARATITPLWEGLGVYGKGGLNHVYAGTTAFAEYPIGDCKILPAPGRAWDFIQYEEDIKPTPKTYQGGINGLTLSNPIGNESDIGMFWSFYASDMLCDAPLFASIFNNGSKGMMVDSDPVIAKAQFPGVTISGQIYEVQTFDQMLTGFDSTNADPLNPNGYLFTVELVSSTDTPNNLGGDILYTFTPQSGNPDILEGTIRVRVLGVDPNIAGLEVFTDMDVIVDISDLSNVLVTFAILPVVGVDLTILVGGTATGTMSPGSLTPNPATWVDANHPTSLAWRTFNVGPFNGISVENNTINIPVIENGMNLEWQESSWDLTGNITISGGDVCSVKQVEMEAHYFRPAPMTEPSSVDPDETIRRSYMQYVLHGQDGYSNDQFASRADRNLFYGFGGSYFDPVAGAAGAANGGYLWDPTVLFTQDNLAAGFNPTGYGSAVGVVEFDPTTVAPSLMTQMWQTNVNFEDYVGVRLSVFEPKFTFGLHNDWAGHALDQGTQNTQNGMVQRWTVDGVRWAVQTNIYNGQYGALDAGEWKVKYNNLNTNESYHAITKRFRWEDVSNNNIDIYAGDCFMTYTYKRVQRPLGISGVDTASDWRLYNSNNRAAGLVEHGICFPMILECNYNTAQRAFEEVDAVESLLYGKDRSFFPVDDIDDLRSSKQPESHGYNHGYSWGGSDRVFAGLNDRAPSLNINYGNRVMVSAPSVSGNFFNGYTDFSGLNFRDYNKQLGEITSIISHNDVCYAIFETGVGVVPVNQRTMISEQTGGVFLDDAQVLAQKMQVISTEYGSDQQFSIIKTDEYVYGVDFSKNKIWRIVSGGGGHRLELISDFAIQSILNVFKTRLRSNQLRDVVKSNYDRNRNNVIFSYYNEVFGQYLTDFYDIIVVPDDPTTPDPDDPTDVNAFSKYVNDQVDPDGSQASARASYLDKTPAVPGRTPSGTVPVVVIITDPEDPNVGQPATSNDDGTLVPINQIDNFGNDIFQLIRSNDLGSVYWNETLGKWISRLSWNPIWTFNVESNLYSFNSNADREIIWEHFSAIVPWCHFYGRQEKFVFEFMIVDNASAQKILDNMMFICNRAFPGRVDYNLLENDFDFELQDATTAAGAGGVDNGYRELLKQRHEANPATVMGNSEINAWDIVTTTEVDIGGLGTLVTSFTMSATNGDPISQCESERIAGGYVTWNGVIYIIGPSFENNGIFYNEVWDQNGNNIVGPLPATWDFDSLDFGIIQQNMEYIEDHLYVEVGQDEDESRVRDKAIRVRVTYEGYDYYTIQSVISSFVYSFG